MGLMFLNGLVLHEEPCTDPYARFCGQTEAAASSDPINGIRGIEATSIMYYEKLHTGYSLNRTFYFLPTLNKTVVDTL